MEESGIKEILNEFDLHSAHIDQKLDQVENRLEKRMDDMKTHLENRMDQRFDRLEEKIDHLRTDLTETQETVDFLSIKNVQHERKLREIYNQQP